MAKQKTVFECWLPGFDKVTHWTGWMPWRKLAYETLIEECRKQKFSGYGDNLVELEVWAHLIDRMDIDNCLKNILDALQGRIGEKEQRAERIMNNDKQVCRVIIEKHTLPQGKSVYRRGRTGPGRNVLIKMRPYRLRTW